MASLKGWVLVFGSSYPGGLSAVTLRGGIAVGLPDYLYAVKCELLVSIELSVVIFRSSIEGRRRGARDLLLSAVICRSYIEGVRALSAGCALQLDWPHLQRSVQGRRWLSVSFIEGFGSPKFVYIV